MKLKKAQKFVKKILTLSSYRVLNKQVSPFKENVKPISKRSFLTTSSAESKTVDLRCSIIENFKGHSNSPKIENFIPCIFMRNPTKTNKILVYFHGNSEDLAGAYQFFQFFKYRMDVHIIAVEYPGYGVYEGTPSEESVYNDAIRVMEFIQKVLK